MSIRFQHLIYKMLRPLLFKLDPERAHQLTLKALKLYSHIQFKKTEKTLFDHPVTVMGVKFPNPIGLAAGFDNNGHYIDALGTLGFGFMEIGTVTPKPQVGSSSPRLMRLDQEKAMLNRIGFNNEGVFSLMERLEKINLNYTLGINIGKNTNTHIDHAHEDYLYCYRKVYSKASYVSVNISSPNTPLFKALQFGERFNTLLSALKEEQERLIQRFQYKVPLVLKIAPDLSLNEIEILAQKLLDFQWEGVIASNTLPSNVPFEGGLSGLPLFNTSTQLVRTLANILQGRIPIIASGGILTGDDAIEKLEAGASLVQIYTGLIYRGPKLIKEISDKLHNKRSLEKRNPASSI